MVKVLIVDSNDERRKTITTGLRSNGHIVSAMAMISMDSLLNVTTSHEVAVLLDQDTRVINTVITSNAANQMMQIITNAPTELKDCSLENVYFIDEDLNETDEKIINLIQRSKTNNSKLNVVASDVRSQAMLQMTRKVATTNSTVLITGETGTGKEVLAHYLHECSLVSKGPFIAVNCAALPENMMEAILFGYEKGSFTSAVNSYVGKFEQAHNGTLLLDEISEIPLGLQAKLLRVLQEREIERLGGKKIIKVNVRIIAATNCDLAKQVIDGHFRKDLFYRLNVISIRSPSLRERPNDILPLVDHFLSIYCNSMNKDVVKLSNEAKNKLLNYSWPGNIRELDNVVQRALIMMDGEIINEDDISIDENMFERKESENVVIQMSQFNSCLEESEAKVILEVLKESDGCRNSAAKKLNISPRTLRYKIAKLRAIGLQVP